MYAIISFLSRATKHISQHIKTATKTAYLGDFSLCKKPINN